MQKKFIPSAYSKNLDYELNDFNLLLKYIEQLAQYKLGYPVSLLTFLGAIDNKFLGITPGSLANVLLNNVGDPYKDSETSRMEVKRHERKILSILENYYGLPPNGARGYVTTGGTEGNFASLWWSKRYMINMSVNTLIDTDNTIKLQLKEEQDSAAALAKIPTNDYPARTKLLQKIIDIKNSILANKNITQQLLSPTVFYSKDNTHYSVPKIAEILRLNLKPIGSNPDGSIDLKNFKKELLFHLGSHPHSGIIVVANIGTTITGAIDDVPGIKKILDETKSKPLYTIHLDGALTGFVMPILKPFGEVKNYFDAIGANTLAVSAHKYPGLSQPCGIVLAEKTFFEKAFEKSERNVSYVGNILDVTITGSRSGLNVLMLYNALITLKLDQTVDVLAKMVKENLKTAKYLFEQLVIIYGPDKVSYPHHFNISFPQPSMDIARKYQLMLTGNRATICVLTNVNKTLIDQFTHDLKLDLEETAMKNVNITPTIHILQNTHAASATELFINAFCNNEPITKHLDIHQDEYANFAREVIQKAIQDKMSLVAVDENNQVIAFIIAEDIANRFNATLANYPKLRPVIAILEELSKPFIDEKIFLKNKIAHIWLAAVKPDITKHGVFKNLNTEIINMLAQNGFEFAYAEFTNSISEKITSQFQVIELCNRINYNDFVLDGKKPFEGLEGSAASYVACIQPEINLDDLQNCYDIKAKHSEKAE